VAGIALDAGGVHAERRDRGHRLVAERVGAEPADHDAPVADARDAVNEVERRAAEHPARGQEVPEHLPEGDEAVRHASV